MTIIEHVVNGRVRLHEAGIPREEAALDARLLAQHVLLWDTSQLLTSGHEPASDDFAARYDALVGRRASREPLAYITGQKEFWGLTFEVSGSVLIPRPETELLVETALERFPDPDADFRVADVCTGSGCIGIAIAWERPQARLVATDVSEPALATARRNALRCGVAARIDFIASDLLNGLTGTFDLIVANPPYVREPDRAALQSEVRDYEPDVALFGGSEGLDLIDRLVKGAAARLNPGGFLMFEFGNAQEEPAADAIDAAENLTLLEIRSDLRGLPRAAIARRLS